MNERMQAIYRGGKLDLPRDLDLPDGAVVTVTVSAETPTPAKLHVNKPGEGHCISVVGDLYRFLVTGAQSGGRYALWEATVPPGGGPPLHVHSREDEAFLILEGEMTFRAGDDTLVAGPGTLLSLPPGLKHAFRNNSDRPVRMLILIAPAGLEKMFEETGVAMPNAQAQPLPPSHEEIERLLKAAPRYGVTIFPPGS